MAYFDLIPNRTNGSRVEAGTLGVRAGVAGSDRLAE